MLQLKRRDISYDIASICTGQKLFIFWIDLYREVYVYILKSR